MITKLGGTNGKDPIYDALFRQRYSSIKVTVLFLCTYGLAFLSNGDTCAIMEKYRELQCKVASLKTPYIFHKKKNVFLKHHLVARLFKFDFDYIYVKAKS